jgi:squalene-associated FAD-dependent desaturase
MLSWLRAHRATGRAIEAFWRPFLISALNDDLDDIAADYGIMTVVRAFLLNRRGYEVGLPTVPLRDLYTPCIAHLNRFGGCVELDRGAAGFSVSGNRITSVTLTDGTAATADVYLSAVPFDVLLKLLPDKEIAQSAYFGDLRRLEVSPITAVHVWFDRPVTDLAYVAVLGRTIQWVFNLGVRAPDGAGPSGAALGLVVSASDAWMRRPQQEIVQEALEDLRALFPAVREAGLLKTVVVKEGRATFAPRPGCDAWRPGPVSPIANLFVAGDWTQTGWPATMESAVRSGYQSAEAILEAAGKPGRILQPDLAVEGLMRWALGIKT